MWFRRLLRRARKPPPPDLPALDRLEALIGRVIDLVPDQGAGAAEPEADAPAVPAPRIEPAPVRTPEPERPEPGRPETERPETEHLLFLPGYELAVVPGPAPAPEERIEYGGRVYRVLRAGPSPYPGDRRRCVLLDRT